MNRPLCPRSRTPVLSLAAVTALGLGTLAGQASAAEGLPKPVFPKGKASCGKAKWTGKALKPFALKTPKGKAISSKDYRGHVTLVNFWGTWCKPCLKELPKFNKLQKRYAKAGLKFVAIATDEDAGAVQEVVRAKKVLADIAIGGEDYANTYAMDRFPFTFVVDRSGKIVASFSGYEEHCLGTIEQTIRAELARKP